ncbi:MAG: stage V sporulation protein AC [Clostridiales bacterium GWF2_38_85]|nr:MAG: stage V sporulation protein AC [Clostridiales bacterium GWF2_38_85]HBL83605.1 stage V sporulation protein AC [Clostridiales bacterium]
MDIKEYKKYAENRSKRTSSLKNCVLAFIGGGIICVIGQVLFNLYSIFTIEEHAKLLTSASLIFLAGLFTGIGWFDVLAKIFGGGTLVPITGFANAIAAAAIDNKKEGFIAGVGAKMFIIAGSVIVYGVSFSILYGVAYYFYLLLI